VAVRRLAALAAATVAAAAAAFFARCRQPGCSFSAMLFKSSSARPSLRASSTLGLSERAPGLCFFFVVVLFVVAGAAIAAAAPLFSSAVRSTTLEHLQRQTAAQTPADSEFGFGWLFDNNTGKSSKLAHFRFLTIVMEYQCSTGFYYALMS
jgi:hypothetical protein